MSTAGGSRPLWSRNFYQAPDDTLMSVSVGPGEKWIAGMPTTVIERPYFGGVGNSSPRTYDVSPDGRRFLMLKQVARPDESAAPARIVVVQNWLEELKRLVPTRR